MQRMVILLAEGKTLRHTGYGMKMTMHIDETVLAEVMEAFGYTSKTEAVNGALKEMVRLEKLKEFGRTGLGFTPEELKDSVEPGYDPMDYRRVAEPRRPYGKERDSDPS